MRKKLVAALVVGLLSLTGPAALAKGPAGSKESKANEVTCNHDNGPSGSGGNVYQGGNGVYLGTNGAEICSDDNSGIDGRVILSSDGYGAADGDASNPSQGQGWGRVDNGGPTTGGESDPKTNKDNDVTCQKVKTC